jgi:hypothetical protein
MQGNAMQVNVENSFTGAKNRIKKANQLFFECLCERTKSRYVKRKKKVNKQGGVGVNGNSLPETSESQQPDSSLGILHNPVRTYAILCTIDQLL